MKRPFITVLAIILGIVATNALVKHNNTAELIIEDKVETSQAADISL
jgi:hypothetical protein